MAFNIDQVAINVQCDFADITQFSTKTLEDYSIVSRKRLEKIINDSERCLTEDEHRWLIKRDCKRVISNITKLTQKRKSKNVLLEVKKEGNSVKLPTICAINQYVLNNSVFNLNTMPKMLNINPDISAIDSENRVNVIIENNLTVINIQQLNININDNKPTVFEYDDIDETRKKNNSQVDLEKIYWDKWRDYVKKKMSNRKNRCEKIDSFLMKIEEKLNADQMKKSKMYKLSKRIEPKHVKTIYDRQRVKIENQKKLLEKQQEEIHCLKLKQLKLESEKAMFENQIILDQTYRKSEKMLKIKNTPQKSSVVKVSPSDILNRMEIRSLDRQAKWEAIKERRRQMEQENQRKKHQLEQRCLKEQMEQKRKELFEARENLRLKRIEECKQKMEREILRQNVKIADDFYRKFLMKKGLEAFKVNLRNGRLLIEKASNYYNKKILEISFSKWRYFVNNNLNKKIFLAEQFYKKKLMKTAFVGFLTVLEESKKKQQVAEDWYNFKIQEFLFEQWFNYISEINVETDKKMLEAESHHNRVIMKHCFNNWRMFPEIVYKERLKDCRLRTWHEKVQEILPDFIPPELA